MELRIRAAPLLLALFLIMISASEGRVRSKGSKQLLSIEAKETTTANFIRLVIMRLIFGLAVAMGYGESLSNVLGGIFVPPGADYEEDYDYVPNLF